MMVDDNWIRKKTYTVTNISNLNARTVQYVELSDETIDKIAKSVVKEFRNYINNLKIVYHNE